MCTSLLINTDHTRKSFTILADDDDSMNDRFDSQDTSNHLPFISNKIKSVYHQNCVIPNEDFSILYNSIASKLQPPSQHITLLNPNKNLYSPSKEFFNKVSSKLRDLRPKVTPREEEPPKDIFKMERPMFITTVKSGTFLEPPPEVAALLGLRKNSFNGNNTNSSNSSTGKAQNNDRMYSFASKPRILKSNLHTNFASRSLFRVENRREKRETLNEPLPKITNDTSEGGGPSYGNTMFDRRVARGSNFAAQRPNVISTEHVLSRQAEARRRAAVRQRAQIRARKLRLGTPPPIDGRRHGQIQTDKYLEELTERPPDKSIACQADLPVEHHSPVYSLDSNSNTTTGVEAETQIYPGDLPDIDDELPSVVSSIVNKILQEAILEINDEIEVLRLRTLASEQKRAAANPSNNDENGVITKAQLHMLIQQAIDELKNSEQTESNDKNYDDIDSNSLLEKIFHEIKNIVTDVKFLSGIIKTQLENWPETSDQTTAESEQAENDQADDENDNVSESGTIDLRRETLSAADEQENQTADEVLQQMDAEIDAYKTDDDDFEDESKDLNEPNNDENEASDRRNDLDTDSIRDTDNIAESDTTRANEGSDDRPGSANEEGNSTTQPADDADEPTVTATEVIMEQGDTNDADKNEPDEQNESVRVRRSIEENQATDSETAQTNQEVPNDSQSADTNDEQTDTKRDQPSVIISEHNDEDSNPTNNDESAEPPKSTAEEPTEPTNRDSAESTNTNGTPLDNASADSNQNNDDQSPETNNETVQSSEDASSAASGTTTIATLNSSVLDPPVNDSNPEHDIAVTELNSDGTESATASANDQPTVTIPTLNASVLDPPVNDSNPADDSSTSDRNADAETSSENIPPTTSESNQDTLVIPTMNMSVLDPPVNDSNDQASEQEPTTENSANDDNQNENNGATNSPDENQNAGNNPDDGANNNNQISDSNEGQTNQNDQVSTQPSSDPDTTNNQSSETPIEKDPASTNEDDKDVVAVLPPSAESPSENQVDSSRNLDDQPADSSIPASTEPDTTSDNTASQDDPNQNTTDKDNISEQSSSATTKADTESVENNELQSNTTTSADSTTSTERQQNQSDDDGSSQDSEKPLNTGNNTSANDNPDQSNDGASAGEADEPKQDSENESVNSAADSLNVSETATADATSLDRDSSKSPDNDSSNQIDNDVRNNNEPETQGNDKLIETNNNDSTIQSKNPTTIVQNGSIITNR